MGRFFSLENWGQYQARTDKDLPWCKLWGSLFHKLWMKDLADDQKFLVLIFLDLARENGNKIPEENLIKINLERNYGFMMPQEKVNKVCKLLISKGFLSDKCPTNVGLDIDKIREDKEKEKDKIISQISNLLILFSNNGLQQKTKAYLEANALKNKRKCLSPKRQQTLLLELVNTRSRCADDALFEYALSGAVEYKACNIGYVNAIIRNRKTQVVEK